MKFGCCVKNAEEARLVQEAGYDYVECTVVSLLPEQEEDAFQEVLKGYQNLSISIEACCVFLPGDLLVVGESVDYGRIKSYVSSALKRVQQIGAKTVVFGSGRSRTIPDGFSKEIAEQQIIQFLQITADYAEACGITIVIEPLNRKESNVIVSVPEAVRFAQQVNHPSIQALADFYHMDEEQEPLRNILLCKDYIKHIHVADSGRFEPGTGSYPYEQFVHFVEEAGYDGRISIECKWNQFDVAHLRKSLDFLKHQFIKN
jgi:sugar phosphate isomerase/epimerase